MELRTHIVTAVDKIIRDTNAITFNKFMDQKQEDGLTIIEHLKNLKILMQDFENVNADIEINLSEGEQMQFVIDFFHSLNVDLGIQIEEIFTKDQTVYSVEIHSDPKNENYGKNSVGFYGKNPKMWIEITLTNSTLSLRRTAHEFAHSISNRNTIRNKLVQNYNDDENEENYQICDKYIKQAKRCDIDCITEIESEIAELLFNIFLYKNNVISKDLCEKYLKHQLAMLSRELEVVCNDYDLISLLEGEVSEEQIEKAKQQIKGTKLEKVALKKLKLFNERKKQVDYGKNIFRYIVGKMYALVWINNFNNASDFEKSNMIKNYVKYLKNTDKFNLNSASKHLFNKSFVEICSDFQNLLEQQLEL